MPEGTNHLFLPCTDLATYAGAAAGLVERPGDPVPFLCAGRRDLLVSARRSSPLYRERRVPPRADVGVLLSPGRDGVRVLMPMLSPLARLWVSDLATARHSGGRSLLVVSLYEDLCNDLLYPLSETGGALASVHVLTGRDLASLSWMLAKQYAQTAAQVVAQAVLSDIDRPAPSGAAEILGSQHFASTDIGKHLQGKPWRRILFHGHGKDDYLNLGDWTLCGLNAAAPVSAPVTLRPRCGYGYPCFKPSGKLIQVLSLTAAEIVLSSCNSAPLPDAAFYASRYQLLLASIDGTAQSVVAAAKAHDSGRPENELFLHAGAGPANPPGIHPSLADRLNDSVRDMHPYDPFVQYGFPVPDPAAGHGGPHGEPVVPAAVDQPPSWQRDLLRESVERALTFLDSDVLPTGHPLRSRLARFTRKYFDAVAVRHLKNSPVSSRDLLGDLQSLDYAMARAIARDPEDAIVHSLEYWGRRSRLQEGATPTVCGCGRPAQQFSRAGLIRAIPTTICVACPRCGYAHMRVEGGLAMTTSFPQEVRAGEEGVAVVRCAGGRPSVAQLGISVPTYLRDACSTDPVAARVRVPASGQTSTTFTLRLTAEAIPQIYYYTVFAIQDLAVALVRTHFAVLPGHSPARPEAGRLASSA